MNTIDAIRSGLEASQTIALSYVKDLSESDWLHRPLPACNHINWQWGHLVFSEFNMIGCCHPGQMPMLPKNFEVQYGKENAACDDPDRLLSKETLLKTAEKIRQSTLEILGQHTEQSLDAATPDSINSYAPTIGVAFTMQTIHWMMHAGQWAIIRRQLGLPPMI